MAGVLHAASNGQLASIADHPDLEHLTATLSTLPDAYTLALAEHDLDPFSSGHTTSWALVSLVNKVRAVAAEIRGEAPPPATSLLGVGPPDEQGVRPTGLGSSGHSDRDKILCIRRHLATAERSLLRAEPYRFIRAVEHAALQFHQGQPPPRLFLDEFERVDELARRIVTSSAGAERLSGAITEIETLLQAARRAG